jgi:predicted nuclease with TOPRIM domain
MKEQLHQRLQSLKSEYQAGQKMLADLEAKQASLRNTLLRISGAIQVLEETLNELNEEAADTAIDNGDRPPSAVPVEVV